MEKQQKINVRDMVEIALFTAIIIILAFSPLGYIQVTPAISATTVHIPVILAGVVLGWRKGAITGFLFGLTSFVRATFFTSIPTNFLFSPFYQGGNFWSLVICFVPRILIGIVAAFVFRGLQRLVKNEVISLTAAGICGSLTNTILVMSMAYIFFAEKYLAAAEGTGLANMVVYAVGAIGAVVVANGIPEAVLAAVVTAGVGKALLVVNKNRVIK